MPSEAKVSPPKVVRHGSDSPTHSKTPSISSSTATSTTKRMDSLVDDEIIQKNLKELMDKKNREERKANGRMVAVIVAALVIFCAIYQAWIKKSVHLAGVLVPALIMLSFAGWVVILAKRDKARRALFDKYMEEISQKNKEELEAKKNNHHNKQRKPNERKSSSETVLEYVNEINKGGGGGGGVATINPTTKEVLNTTRAVRSKDHRKHRKYRNIDGLLDSSAIPLPARYPAHKDLRTKRPSIRQKLFRQTGLYHMSAASAAAANSTRTLVQAVINSTPAAQPPGTHIGDAVVIVPAATAVSPSTTMALENKRRQQMQRVKALKEPTMVRMGSAP
ncbi:uncharacterized protein [Musca autumnalis]|uniref:uncharacterized protein n=1 Tax=Musca autumnalis TaxID=221902 RepID=UPI003CFBB632